MTQDHFRHSWDHLRQANGIAMRILEQLPEDMLDQHPISGMRTPKELLVHLYDSVIRGLALGLARGMIDVDESLEKDIVTVCRTKDELTSFCIQCWNAADHSAQSVSEIHLDGIVKTPWGRDLPGFVVVHVMHDEFFHHRGQLYAYARALGLEPPDMWDFAHNAPEFQPQSAVV